MNREDIIAEANKRFPQFRLNRDYSIGEDREKQAFIEGALWSDMGWALKYENLLLKYEAQKEDFEKRYKNLKKKCNDKNDKISQLTEQLDAAHIFCEGVKDRYNKAIKEAQNKMLHDRTISRDILNVLKNI